MLIQSLFSKSLEDLTEEDVELFFKEPKSETDKLEFKCYKKFASNLEKGTKALKDSEAFKSILTTICAFLNTDGGVLIWGAPEGKADSGKEKQFYGPLSPVAKGFEKDQIINKIVSNINPTPNRILFKAIPVQLGGFVYVFEVLASDFAPHQVNGTYYMRLDGQTRFAPHQYVDGLIRRIQTPRLRMQFNFGEVTRVSELVMLPFIVSMWNTARQVNEKNVHFTLKTFAHVQRHDETFVDLKEDTKIDSEIAKVLHYGNPIRQTYILITTYNHGYGRRRIPLYASLSGDTAAMVFSKFDIEFLFSDSGTISYNLLSTQENLYGHDLVLEEEQQLFQVMLVSSFIKFTTSESGVNMKKWKHG